jgi:hypothetical protein
LENEIKQEMNVYPLLKHSKIFSMRAWLTLLAGHSVKIFFVSFGLILQGKNLTIDKIKGVS